MRHKTVIRYFVISLFTLLCITAKANNYGLRMKSHDFSGRDKTSLVLLGGKPISIGDNISVNFTFDIRRAPIFGNILTLVMDNGTKLECSIAPYNKTGDYNPTIIVNSKIYPLNHYLHPMHAVNRIKAQLVLDKKSNSATFFFGGKKRTVSCKLSSVKNAVFYFGRQAYDGGSMDVAPIDLYDIDVKRDGKPLYFWKLGSHTDSISFDRISHAPAVAQYGIWLFDCHTEWQKVFSYHSNSEVQYVFSHKQNKLFIFDDDSLITWDMTTGQRTARHVSGYRIMRYSKYLYFNENDQKIYNYNLQRKQIISFDFDKCQWNNAEYVKDEPAYINHSQASTGGDVFYSFGGYGFYRYNNTLFRLNTSTGKVEPLHYSPLLDPRTTAASAIVGDKLYIFGGLGNKVGKQELPQKSYADLWEINLKTLKAQRLWSAKGKNGLALSSQMIYSPSGKCFYVATSEKQILRLPLAKPNVTVLGDTIPVNMYFDVLNYSIFESKSLGKMLVVVDRLLKDKGHILEAYTIDLPILPLEKETEKSAGNGNWWLWAIVVVVVILLVVAAVLARRRKITKEKKLLIEQQFAAKQNREETERKTEQTLAGTSSSLGRITTNSTKHYYDGHTSEIRMLGEFLVFDRHGNDITSKFTPRTRNLMMMLFLHSATKDKGIEIRQLDEALWPNMNDEAARNNRNVYMRKLRVLLEEVGDIEITNDKINYKVTFGTGTLFDFGEANAIMDAIDAGDNDDTLLQRILELLLRGPLLPNNSTEWLDDLKANYSNRALTLLHRLASRAFDEGKYDLAYNLADAIMVHDPFSEEALAMQCQILCMRKTVGIAKILYDKFCKTYQQAMGEQYEKTFAEVCKGSE